MVLAPEHPMVDALTATCLAGGHAAGLDRRCARRRARRSRAYRAAAARRSELDRQAGDRAKTGVFTGSYATNPVNGAQMPVFIADYVLMGYGTGAIMAVPGQDERDWEFAEVYDLPIVRTVQPPDGFEAARRSPATARRSTPPTRTCPGRHVRRRREGGASSSGWRRVGRGRGAVTYRLRDWLFSRQRYWGEPFPIVYDETGLPIALPESMLPVELPETDDFSPKSFPPDDADSTPEPPLGRLTDWVEVELDLGDGPKKYRRETNTMPNWAGSCWYELRYLDPTNERATGRPGGRALLDGAERRPSAGRRRAVRRRRRARGAASAVRPVLAQGAVRPGLRVLVRAVPPAGQPGHVAAARVHERGRLLRAGG